jgi:PST family polysaccharide transporter
MKDLKRKTVSGVIWSLFARFGQQLISLAVLFVLARLLAPESFGLFALAGAFTRLSMLLISSGLTSAIVQKEELEGLHLDTAFWINFLLAAVLMVLLISFSGLIADSFAEPLLGPIIGWMSLTILLGGMTQVQTQILTRNMSFASLSKRLLFAAPISGVIGVSAALSGLGVWSLVIRDLSFQFVMLIVLWRVNPWRPKFRVSLSHAWELLSFGASQMGSNVVEFLRTQGVVLIIGSLLGSKVLGYYHLASRLQTLLINTLSQSVGRVSWSLFSRLQSRQRELKRAYLKIVRFSTILSWPLFLGLCVIASMLMPVAFGESWGPSVPVLQALSILAFFKSATIPMSALFVALGKPGLRLTLLAFETVLGLGGSLLVVRWGVGAVAWALVASAVVITPLYLRNAHRMMGLQQVGYLRQIWPTATAALIMMSSIYGTSVYLLGVLSEEVTLFVSVALGVILYSLIMLLLDRSVIGDVRELVALMKPARYAGVADTAIAETRKL